MAQIQMPAVAGLFYPADPGELASDIQQFLAQAHPRAEHHIKALIAPHAGYVYSGPVAASAYASLSKIADRIERVVVLAPAHRVPFRGIATSSAEYFRTPLGDVPVDDPGRRTALALPEVELFDTAFQGEHAVEVQLPFLQSVLGDFKLIPFVIGEVDDASVARLLDSLWGGDETLIVISSDLSHYHDYRTAQALDSNTTEAIEHLEPERIGYEDACGRNGVNGLLLAAREHGLHAETLDLRNSGDTAGPKDRVVGYGAYVFH